MKRPVYIRDKLSISQEQLANYLGVSRSIINMYELGLRSLPTAAMLKLGRMEIAYENASSAKQPEVKEKISYRKADNTSRLVAALQKKAIACRKSAASLQLQLTVLQEQYHSLSSQLIMAETLLQAAPEGPDGEIDRSWLKILKEEMYIKMIAAGTEEQFMLQHRISLLLNEAGAHENALDQLAREKV